MSASEEEVTALRNLAVTLNVERNVHFVGNVPYERVHLYNQAVDVVVFVPSYDGMASSILEAMSCGDVPVISDLPSVREWIIDGWNGILVDPNNVEQIADSIVSLLENEIKRKSFGERNWKLIKERGDQDYWMGNLEEIYYSLFKKNKEIL